MSDGFLPARSRRKTRSNRASFDDYREVLRHEMNLVDTHDDAASSRLCKAIRIRMSDVYLVQLNGLDLIADFEPLEWLMSASHSTANMQNLDAIVCFGIGSFDSDVSRDQLAFIMNVADTLNVACHNFYLTFSKIRHRLIFDPCMDSTDVHICSTLGFTVMPKNTVRIFAKLMMKESLYQCKHKTLFYMPRCPLDLYTNMLTSNSNNLSQVFLLGNNLENYQDRFTLNEWSQKMARLLNAFKIMKVVNLPDLKMNGFNNLALHSWASDD